MAQSLNLSAGFTGLISLAQAGFYGIGAYCAALLSTRYGVSFWLSVPVGMLIGGLIALLISFIALRTVEDYFIICTMGIQVILFSLMNNLSGLTGGPLGISGIPAIRLFGVELDGKVSFLLLSLCFVIVVWFLLRNISRSGFGRILRAIREDEIYTQSIGKNVYQAKVISFTLTAMLATIPGALYAHYITYIDPTTFTMEESIFILSIVIVGGMGSLLGSIGAAAFMILLPEGLRFLGMPHEVAGNLREIIYGLILIIIVMTGRLQGLLLWKRGRINK
ncbi:branched-chain amino acid ABC transporter permease [Niastella koreensis]|uniref:Branched-chain amino acid ABC transporter permease n=1 Tax=Niastella koreensis TaxID=354356 RepID=A0ABX3NNX2_9BACT|nr:branched-chain amino acid ABC transporter permease [Niastella koreensis]